MPNPSVSDQQLTGRVITRFGAELILETAQGETIRATTRRKLEHIACGDYVAWQTESQGNASVIDILPRQNVLLRPDMRGKPRAVAANIDVLLVVSSWRPAPNWEMLDRYLIAARHLPTDVIIIMNKADLRAAYSSAEQEAALAEYEQVGYPVYPVQAKTGQGLSALRQAIKGKTAIFAGQSGVGKSSLVSALVPELDLKIGAIADTGEGRHTTTVASLYHLPEGGALIDSPGVRDFPLLPLSVLDLQAGYPEFQAFMGMCRFNNCTHHHEPGCAIKAAIASHDLPPQRYQRYLTLLAGQNNN
ncbi:ribosome small subunit-dependent GTPase A [Thiolinea disciformis]|uniref:ribosome small subunit-dependent GTPase A n=1 Tax=Thiolinea disciformis TaxID=125614 RepID=UPI0003724811|nr:ribosome small subunit-dependent GTPase A [Thiolinea disciformis]